MIEGALILLAGILAGRFAPARKRGPKPPKPVTPVCRCSHGLETHDPDTKRCHGAVKAYRYNSATEEEVLDKYVDCRCRQYTGPLPLSPEYFAPDIAT